MIWLITGVVCFILLRNFLSKLEMNDRNGWRPFRAPLWLWTLAALICLVPLINIMGLVCIEILAIDDIRSCYPDLRFKKGKSHWLTKLIDFMNKEF